MIEKHSINIQNNSNNGNINIQVNYYNSCTEYSIHKELSELNQEQKEMVLNFIKKLEKDKRGHNEFS